MKLQHLADKACDIGAYTVEGEGWVMAYRDGEFGLFTSKGRVVFDIDKAEQVFKDALRVLDDLKALGSNRNFLIKEIGA